MAGATAGKGSGKKSKGEQITDGAGKERAAKKNKGQTSTNADNANNSSDGGDVTTRQDDPFPQQWAAAQLGTIIIDAHVQKLKDAFMGGIRRTENENFMRVSVSAQEWGTLLDTLAIGITGGSIPNPVSLEGVPPTATSLAALVKSTNSITTHKAPNAAVIVPFNSLPWRLRLEAGQHRQAALCAVNQAGINSVGDEDYLWPVNLYLRDSLDFESLIALRANRDNVSKQDANGDLLVRAARLLDSKSLQQRTDLLKPRNMKVWLQQVHGYFISNPARLLNILRSGLRDDITAYCKTRYGAQHFTITWGAAIILGCIDFIWAELLSNFVAHSKAVFGKNFSVIPSTDYERIMGLGALDEDNLRLLFFPSAADFESGNLKSRSHQLPEAFVTATNAKWPALKLYTFKKRHYNTRRPGFLVALTDEDYIMAFSTLLQTRTSFDSWKRWGVLAANHMLTVQGILCHVMVWFDEDWVFPEKASEERKIFHWDVAIRDTMLRDSTLEAGGERGFNKDADDLHIARSFIWKIWNLVEADEIWQDDMVKKEVLDGTKRAIGKSATRAEFNDYKERFNYGHWSTVLSEATKIAGPALYGSMAAFNDRSKWGDASRLSNAFGHLATKLNWKENHDIKGHRLLRLLDTKQIFVEEFGITGAIVLYRRLKIAMVLTLKHGFPNTKTKSGRKAAKVLISSKEEWVNSIALIRKYEQIIALAGWDIDVDNINEALEQFSIALFRQPSQAVESTRLPGFINTVPLGPNDKVSKDVQKWRDSIVAPAEGPNNDDDGGDPSQLDNDDKEEEEEGEGEADINGNDSDMDNNEDEDNGGNSAAQEDSLGKKGVKRKRRSSRATTHSKKIRGEN
ncbi:hypothetical protein BJX63DRAFT_438650 [Aspergillus granulosus]|uniref:Uncharacterized protein n=1 Tax=Aspergillus granulosus TaxID=176169 RepID=A0ABR4GRA1_9EURO